jgi:hypothetical protein
MFGWLLRIFTGDVVGQLTNAYLKAKDSAVESEKTRASVLETQLANALEAQRLAQQVRLATAGFWEMRVITAAIALPFVIHLWLVGLDTCFSLGWRIPAFPPPFAEWQGYVLLSFFGIQLGAKGINAVAAAFIARRS